MKTIRSQRWSKTKRCATLIFAVTGLTCLQALAAPGDDHVSEPQVSRSESALLEKAAALAAKNPNEAAKLLSEQADSNSSAALDYAAGVYAARSNQTDLAAKSFRNALRKMPSFLRARFELGRMAARQRNYAEAAEQLRMLLNTEYARRTHFWDLIAFVYQADGKLAAALAAYRQVLLRDPDNHNAKLGIIRAYAEQHRLSQAKHLINDILASEPGNAELWKALAQAYRQSGNDRKALVMLECARRLSLADANTLATLGDLYFKLGIPRQAARLYRKDIMPASNPPVERMLRAVDVLLHVREDRAARKLLTGLEREDIPLTPEQMETRELLAARLHLQSGAHDKAAALYRKILESNPINGEALLRLSQILLEREEHLKAEVLLERARRLRPYRAEALVGLARVDLARDHLEDAIRRLKESLAVEDNRQVASFLRQIREYAEARPKTTSVQD